jgi:acyl-CoA synthetase (AMP-forming)/AMP-acid ligase II
MTAGWNWADVWELIADVQPDAPALVHAGVRRTWTEFDRRADGVALALLEAGLERGDTFAQYLYNSPEYLESVFAGVKLGFAPVNTNYRYVDDELVYLWDNADVGAVVFAGSFRERIEGLRDRVSRVRLWLWVDDGSGPCPAWASPYEMAAASAEARVTPPWDRTGDDLYLLYTGGTTGMPKGVMWRQDDLYNFWSEAVFHDPVEADLEALRARVEGDRPKPVGLPAAPLMHGTGAFLAFQTLMEAGSVVTLTSRSFDVEELLDTIERERVTQIALVGDAFAKPVLRALDEQPDRWDLSSLRIIVSSGVMWSRETKEGLSRHHPDLLMVDVFSSSEAMGMGSSISSGRRSSATATFRQGERTIVVTDDGRRVEPGSDEVGLVAVGGWVPLGYHKDPEKSARTFREIDGRRYAIPGDYATVDADGKLRLLGRGSVCINTGGEKVYPEEVEEALKLHPGVRDAVVVGVPHERFGESIVALVEGQDAGGPDEKELIAFVRQRLAAYKAPRRVLAVPTIGRAANGKVDYRRLRAEAVEVLTLRATADEKVAERHLKR